jgi:S-adenosylmethionine:tRNA ribosyltransferase-isomerase
MLKKSDFYFDLPEELIAQDPLEDRSSSRLLVLDKESGDVNHRIFKDVIEYLKEGDCLVLNNTKVIPARLLGEREGTGAHVEVLLLKRREGDVWETLVKPGKKCRPGTRLSFGDGLLKAEVLETVEEGNRLIHFEYEGIFEEVLDKLGAEDISVVVNFSGAEVGNQVYSAVIMVNTTGVVGAIGTYEVYVSVRVFVPQADLDLSYGTGS